MSTNNELPAELPGFSTWLSSLLGFKLPALPQTVKNADRAIGRIVGATGENIASRIESRTALIKAQSEGDVATLKTANRLLVKGVSTDESLKERALEYAVRESIIKQQNREEISFIALEHLSKADESAVDADASVDNDWLNEFSEMASHKSDKDIRELWGRILAGKIRRPKSFSLQSLKLLASLSTDDANLLHSVLGLSISGEFIFNENDGNRDISDFLRCEELGAISGVGGFLTRNITMRGFPIALFPPHPQAKLRLLLKYCTTNIIVESEVETTISIPNMTLTRFGRELYSLSDNYEFKKDYFDKFINHLKSVVVQVFRQDDGSSVLTVL